MVTTQDNQELIDRYAEERIIPEEGWLAETEESFPSVERRVNALAGTSNQYSADDIRLFHETLDKVNGVKRSQGRTNDVVSHQELSTLIDHAESDDSQVQGIGLNGLLLALRVEGGKRTVTGLLLRAVQLIEANRRLLFATNLAAGIRRSVGLISTISDRLKPQLARSIWQLARGKDAIDVEALYKLLIDDYGLTEQEAQLVALDQSRKYQGSLSEAYQVANGVKEYIWETMKDDRVRPTHRTKQGRRYRWDSPPPDTGPPGHDINCFPGSVRISPVGLKASVGYRYVGELVEITLRNGVQLTTTPNHPVLTQSGWRGADLIQEGDYLFVHPLAGELSKLSSNPNLREVNPFAEDLHRLFGGLADMGRSGGRNIDLHGSPARRDKYIDVVNIEGELGYGLEALFRQEVVDFLFKDADSGLVDVLLPFFGGSDFRFVGSSAISSFGVSSTSQILSLLSTELSHADKAGLAPVSSVEVEFLEAQANSASTNTQSFGHFKDGNLVGVHSADVIVDKLSLFESNHVGSLVFDSQITKAALNDLITDSKVVSDSSIVESLFSHRFNLWQILLPSFTPMRVSSVRILNHDAPVYVQETETGLIIANGILTHNCRCRAIPVVSSNVRKSVISRLAYLDKLNYDSMMVMRSKGSGA